jgi:hypothetical protein
VVNSFGVVFGCRRENGLEIGMYCPLLVFYSLILIEHLFAINLIEALHCRGGITKHTDMNRQNERGGRRKVPRTAPENDQSANTDSPRRRKVPRTAPEKRSIQVVSGAGKSPGRRQKNDQSAQTASGRSSSPNLTRKVQDWRDWTYTGSLKRHEEGQVGGSGAYHPCLLS